MDGGDITEPDGLRVVIDQVVYQPQQYLPSGGRHCFVYFITIHNGSGTPVTIKGRKWVVHEASGEVTVLEGDGVVGEFPRLEPGDEFSYNSFHVLETPPGRAEGSYLGVDDGGQRILVRIPSFDLVIPESEVGYA